MICINYLILQEINSQSRLGMGRVDQESIDRQQDLLEKELARVQNQLKISHKVRLKVK